MLTLGVLLGVTDGEPPAEGLTDGVILIDGVLLGVILGVLLGVMLGVMLLLGVILGVVETHAAVAVICPLELTVYTVDPVDSLHHCAENVVVNPASL